MNGRVGALACLSGLAAAVVPHGAMAAVGHGENWQIGLQPAATPIMEAMTTFNDYLNVIIVAIVVFVMALLAWVMIRYRESANPVPARTTHNSTIEILWTIVPVLILVGIAIPSFRLLFQQFDFPKADVVIKATGKQWYWSYEYPSNNDLAFDAFPVEDKDLKPGQLRHLSTDNPVVVPVNKVVQVLITGADVIHQWAVPAFGSRADGIPGRVNRTWFKVTAPGVYYGECSALCGQGHDDMPIEVRAVSEDEFKKWVEDKLKQASAAGNQVASAQTAETRPQ